MFLDIFELCKEKEKNNSSEKNVLKLWSQILSKMAVLVHEISLKKSARKKKHINLKNLKEHFFQSHLLDTLHHFVTNLIPHYQNSLSITFNVCFLLYAQKCLETCVNYVWYCITPLLTAPWGPIFKKKIAKNIFLPHLKCKTCSEGDIWNILRRRITDLKNQWSYKSQLCKKWVGALHFRQNWLAITFTWPNEP